MDDESGSYIYYCCFPLSAIFDAISSSSEMYLFSCLQLEKKKKETKRKEIKSTDVKPLELLIRIEGLFTFAVYLITFGKFRV